MCLGKAGAFAGTERQAQGSGWGEWDGQREREVLSSIDGAGRHSYKWTENQKIMHS